MNVLYTTHTSPDYMPPLKISEQQIVVGPKYPTLSEGGLVKSLNVAKGRVDLAALVSSLPAAQRPELTVVLLDAFLKCVPENLAAVPGRKLLLVADTHHGDAPLLKMLGYARLQPFDAIALIHNPHHLHWFVEAGFARIAYIPNVNCQYFPQPLNERREPAIVFVGHRHQRRDRLFEAIRQAGLPLVVKQAPAPQAASLYNSFQIAINCSLNGDLNMRVFEVMAAGGFLVTDRLSPQAGLHAMFRSGEHYVDYAGPDELIAKLRHYLARPAECFAIAKAGQQAYLDAHHPARRVRDLLDFAFGRSSAPPASSDPRAMLGGVGFGEQLGERIRLYELFQRVAHMNDHVDVVLDAALGPRAIADLADLRLRLAVVEPEGGSQPLKDALGRFGVLDQIAFVAGRPAQCGVQVLHARTLANAREAVIADTQWLAVMAAGDPMMAHAEWLASEGFTKVGEAPWLFQRTRHARR